MVIVLQFAFMFALQFALMFALMFAPSVLIISVHVKRIRKSEGKIEEGN